MLNLPYVKENDNNYSYVDSQSDNVQNLCKNHNHNGLPSGVANKKSVSSQWITFYREKW